MTPRAIRKAIADAGRAQAVIAEVLTRAIAAAKDADPRTLAPLLRARDAANYGITEMAAALRQHDDAHEDPDKTPVRPPSQSAMQAFQASQEHSARAAEALERKKGP